MSWLRRKSKVSPKKKSKRDNAKPEPDPLLPSVVQPGHQKQSLAPEKPEKSEPEQAEVPKEEEEEKKVDEHVDNEIINAEEIKSEAKTWKLDDAVSIYLKSSDEYLPGIVVEIDDKKQEITVRFWDIATSLEPKYKKEALPTNAIKKREYSTTYDPWDIPMDDQHKLQKIHYEVIRNLLSTKFDKFDFDIPNDKDINDQFVKFKKFLKAKKEMRKKNPFLRLISSNLCENVNDGWMEIFVNYIFLITLFQKPSNDNPALYELKLQRIFDIVNIGSDTIDNESLQIICMMYAKSWMIESQNETKDDKLSETEEKARKNEIAKLAKRMLDKITAYDSSIDFTEFKGFISTEMTQMINENVTKMVLDDKFKFI